MSEIEKGTTTVGTILKMGATSAALTEVADLIDFSDMLGSSDKIETTTMKDKARTYKKGLKDPGNMTFTFLYSGMATGTNYATLKAAETSGDVMFFSLVFPDASGYTWSGTVSLSMPGKGVAEALQFVLSIFPETAIAEIAGS